MGETPVSRIMLQPEPRREPLVAGRPQVRRYRLARLEEVASDTLGALPSNRIRATVERPSQSPLNK
jgi:hypothetical protein